MSFKLNHPDDHLPDEPSPVLRPSKSLPEEFLEQELPADFVALAEQLTADAQRLSGVYPACKPPLELIEALGGEARRASWPRQIVALASAAAGILLMLGLIGFALSPVWMKDQADATPVLNPPAELVHQTTPSALPAIEPVSYRPALADMDGPELEGLLDLFQEQPGSTISF